MRRLGWVMRRNGRNGNFEIEEQATTEEFSGLLADFTLSTINLDSLREGN
jgi:hypothetical protein